MQYSILSIVTILFIILFYSWKFVPFDPLHPFCPPSTPHPLGNHQFVLWDWLLYFAFFRIPHIIEIMRYLSLSDSFHSLLSMMPSRSIPVVVNANGIHHVFFIHSSIHAHWGCFHMFPLVNNAAMNMGLHIYFQVSVFIFFFR